MTKQRLLHIFCVFYAIFLLSTQASGGVEFTEEEKQWIADHPIIDVAGFKLDPFIVEERGKVTGYFTEVFTEIATEAGLRPRFHFMPLGEALSKTESGEIDATMGLIHNPERAEKFYLSEESFPVVFHIFMKRDHDEVQGVEDLAGRRIASYKKYSLNAFFEKAFPNALILMADDAEGMFRLVAEGEADAAIQEFYSGQWILRRALIGNVAPKGVAVFGGQHSMKAHYYGVSRHAPLLASILDKIHYDMAPAAKQRVWDRWGAGNASQNSGGLYLSVAEQAYLASHTFRRQQSLGWMPFSFKDRDGQIIGVAEDYWQLIRNKLGLNETILPDALPFSAILTRFESGKIDIYASTSRTNDREEYALFTKSYEKFPIAVATHKSRDYIFDPKVLTGQKVAVGRNYSAYQLMKKQYPEIDYVQVRNTGEALQLVLDGEAFAAIDVLPSLQFELNSLGSEDLRLSGVTQLMLPIQIMVSKEHADLVPLLNRAISAITPDEKEQIREKWMVYEVLTRTDYSLGLKLTAAFAAALLLVVYWNRRLSKEIAERKKLEKEHERVYKELRAANDQAEIVQHRLHAAIEAIDEGFVIYGPDDRLSLCNAKYHEIYKESADLLVEGASFEDIIRQGVKRGQYPEARGREEEWIAKRLAIHQEGNASTEQKLPDGRWLKIAERKSADGSIVGFRADITELKEAMEKAEASNQEKSQFLATMSHEIRTPLNSVIGQTWLLSRRHDLTPEVQQEIGKIHSAGQLLLALINDILDMSKIEAGEISLEMVPMQLDELLGELKSLLIHQAQGKGLGLSIDKLPLEAESHVICDPTRLRQILINLLSNGIKFTTHGEISLSVIKNGLNWEAEDGNQYQRLHFLIKDTGIGIREQALATLFTPFHQADNSITRVYGGTGLGLAIVKNLTEKMGGRVTVASTPGEGSCFTVELPLQIVSETELAARGLKRENIKLDTGRIWLSGLHILLVDDSAMNLDVARGILKREGATVSTCMNGEEALTWLKKPGNRADIVLMDVQMPVMDGNTTVAQIRRTETLKGLPVIALTAAALSSEKEKSIEAGMDDYLTKPFEPVQMIQVIRHHVEKAKGTPPPVSTRETRNGRDMSWPQIAGVDNEGVYGRMQGNLSLFMNLLHRFIDNYRDLEHVPPLPTTQEERNGLRAKVHKFAGDAGTLGADSLYHLAKKIENDLLDDLLTEIGSLLEELSLQYRKFKKAVMQVLEQYERPTKPDAAAPLDYEKLAALHKALEQKKITAMKLFQELEPALRQELEEERFTSLKAAVGRLDFANALKALQRE